MNLNMTYMLCVDRPGTKLKQKEIPFGGLLSIQQWLMDHCDPYGWWNQWQGLCRIHIPYLVCKFILVYNFVEWFSYIVCYFILVYNFVEWFSNEIMKPSIRMILK